MKSILTAIILMVTVSVYSQGKTITGKVTDVSGVSLPGTNIIEKGTNNGTLSDFEGDFSINVSNSNAILEISYIGFASQEILVGDRTEIVIVLEEDTQVLNVVNIVGIRRSLEDEVRAKREATTVVEAITPQDIGSFADENVIDALERIPGVQVERDYSGNSGSRASIRGLGSQFVQTSINGRTPLSTGNSGISNFREFNQGNIPTEMIHGAYIYKTAEAKAIEGGIGGAIDYELLKPLKAKYLNGKNVFGSITARGTTQPSVDEVDPTHRVSGIFGFRNKEKTFGAHVSVLSSRDITFQESIGAINAGIQEFDLNVDSNLNGIFDPEYGDETISDVIAIERYNLQTKINTQDRFAIASAIQWEPNENIEVIFDANVFTNSRSESNQRVQLDNSGLSDTELWQPGSFDLSSTNFLTYADRSLTSGNNASVFYQLRQNNFETNSTDVLGGANIIYTKNGWTVDADISLSLSNFDNFNRNGANVNYDTNSSTIFDNRNTDAFFFQIGNDGYLDSANYELTDPDDFGSLLVRVAENRGINSRIDFNKELNKRISIDFGYRYSHSSIRSREAIRTVADYYEDPIDATNTEAIDNIRTGFQQIISDASLSSPMFEDFRIGDNQFPTLNVQDIFALYGGAYEGNIDNFKSNNLFDIPTEDENGFKLRPNNSLDFDETTTAFYTQVNLKKTRKSKFSGNLGVRVVRTAIFSRAYSSVNFIDPLNQSTDITPSSSFQESSNERSRWDVLPSMNLTFKPVNSFQIRLAGSRTMARANVKELVPRNTLTLIDPSSSVADPSSPFYNPDDTSTEFQIGNPDLEPYFAWNSDISFEYYTKSGGALVFAAYHKFFEGFIVNRSIPNAEFPSEDVIGFSVPEASQQFPVFIRQYQNFTDAQLYGFEIGFNQSFSFLPSPFDGFGIRGNYNRTLGSFEEEVGVTENGFPGSSKNSYNGVFYYDKYGIGFRLAYAWRDDFFRVVPDPFGANLGIQTARFQEGAGSLSSKLSYNFNKNFQISISGNNITGEDRRRFLGSSSENLTDFFQLEPTWLIGTRYRF